MKSDLDLAKSFAVKADHDFRMAEIGMAHDAPLDTVAFHLQQTAEKLLKAMLSARSVEFPRTHDVEALLDLALPTDPELECFREPLLGLASYAVEMRYDDDVYPERDEVSAAFEIVRELRDAILGNLPAAARP